MDKLLFLILYLCCSLFHTFMVRGLIRVFLPISRVSKFLEIVAYLLITALNTAIFSLFDNPILTLISSSMLMFSATFLCDATLQKRLITSAIVIGLSMLAESVAAFVFSFELDIFSSSITLVVTAMLMFAILQFLKGGACSRENQKLPKNEVFLLLAVTAICVFIAVVMLLPKLFTNKILVTLCVIGLLLMLIIIAYLYGHLQKTYQKNLENALLTQQNDMYIRQLNIMKETQNSFKLLRHDLSNHLNHLNILLIENQHVEAVKYLNSIYETLPYSSPTVTTGNSVIDSIVNFKTMDAKQKGINIKSEISVPEVLNITPFDLNTVLSNLLDNAIYATSFLEVSDKKVDLSIRFDKGIIYLHIENSYLQTMSSSYHLKPERVGEHGLGLESVKRVLGRYNGTIKINSEVPNTFCVDILIYL